MKKRESIVGESSQAIEQRSSEGVGGDLVLEPKHKIFLSHSGVQKDFVEHLCQALEGCCRYPFFDQRRGSLPKGREFPSWIIKAVEQCQLFVVVVSEDYFMSKWPMIELNAFVQASKVLKSNMNVAILPLFYGLSVSDLKDKKRQQRWLEKWKTFANEDRVEGRIKVDDWNFAVDALTNFNGLNRESKGIVAYENEIVSHICDLVLPDIKWHDSHVQGNAHKVVLDKMKQIGLSQKYKGKVVGIYGVGGIGKTTICKTLCNELLNEYEGRVCHVEFDNTCSNSKKLLQNATLKLTKKSADLVCQLDEGECKDVLYNNCPNQRMFLAIDNVWDDNNSIKQAKMFLKTPFHDDSLVVVTTRSQSTLALLGINGDACVEMPELGLDDARSLFLYHAIDGKQLTIREDMDSIERCVQKCYFCKGDGGSYHYHPLALEALGRQLSESKEKPSEWEHRLSKVWEFRPFTGENGVFHVLRSSFDLLHPVQQTLFMDVVFFLLGIKGDTYFLGPWISVKEKLFVMYGKDELGLQSQLDSLKRKGLLQDADLELGRFTTHDLYHEFVAQEVGGNLGEIRDMLDREWMLLHVIDGDLSKLEAPRGSGCWPKLSRLFIHEEQEDLFEGEGLDFCLPADRIKSLEGIVWQNFSNIGVLQLCGLKFVKGSLNLEGIICLRSLELYNLSCLERLEGLESLKYLTCFEWRIPFFIRDKTSMTHLGDQFPASLRYLNVSGQCLLLGSKMLTRCKNLIKIKLQNMEVGELLDLSNCLSLEGVEIFDIEGLQTLLVPTTTRPSRLHDLKISLIDGIQIPRLDKLDGLLRLELVLNDGNSWEASSTLSLTNLQTLKIDTHSNPLEDWIPHQLQELYYASGQLREAPCLKVFKQLQVLDLSMNWMTRMDGMGALPALRSLDLHGCLYLEWLPTLSESRNLQELILDRCDRLTLHEEDFVMLSALYSLYPVRFSGRDERNKIRLDVVERKVLRYMRHFPRAATWIVGKEGEWEKLDLGLPPIKIGERFIGDTYSPVESRNHGIWQTSIASNMEEVEDIEYEVDEVEDNEFDMEEVEDTESDIEEVDEVEDMESKVLYIQETYDVRQIIQENSVLCILRPPSLAFGCSVLFWVVVDYIKEFWVAKVFPCN